PVEAGLSSNVAEGTVAVVAHHEVGRAILRVEIWRGITILISSLVIEIEAEINVEPAVTIVVGDGCAGERALRRIRELKGVWLVDELATTLIHEEQRPGSAHDDQILAAVVVEVSE